MRWANRCIIEAERLNNPFRENKFLVERFRVSSVETVMVSVRIIVAALMTLLWSLPPARGYTSGCYACAGTGARISVHLHGFCEADLHSGSVQTIPHAVKSWNRRFSSPPNPNEDTAAVSHDAVEGLEWKNLFGAGDHLERCVVLAHGWQFELRTALNPRAPSFLS
jgi:hypothetical protein